MSSNVSLASILPDLASPESLVLPLALKVQWRVCARSILEGPLCKLIQINVQTLEHLVCSRACAGFVRKRFDIAAQIPAPKEGCNLLAKGQSRWWHLCVISLSATVGIQFLTLSRKEKEQIPRRTCGTGFLLSFHLSLL